MSYSERTHPNRDYRHKENPRTNRYIDERSRTPYAANGRSSTPEPSSSSSVFTEPYQRYPAATHGDARYLPQPYPPKLTFSEKCSNLCSRRGILQFVEVIVNILVLVCIGAAQASLSGFSAMAGLGSFSLDSAYSPFEGTELQEVRDLDMQYSQMRAPCVYGGVAFSLTMMCLTLLFLIGGGKPIYRLSLLLLGSEFVFDILACLGYIAAVGLYLHVVIQVNATDVCRRRERLYMRRGYTSMNCSVQGGDASVALFGLVASCLYFASTVVCALTIRSVREFKRQEAKMQHDLDRTYREGERPKAYKSPGSSRSAGTFATLV
ncbi:MARVEL domain-containing protein 3 isoform X2 [Anolis carolinensis]|uniref:MARVEL domain-containing protein n=2 Tax=Anolis carolinensis TaxID=28377 RepID=H9GIC5_ANOCA|nr:PREDICTED: MARVEL domain-containing protein 3 isoform X2 [Anolis carolinensis]XP_008115063.1 PREDICTED: MARVEL domain-containing protein 3 isoform X2 [Anolis carolinensis]XP_008115064.1 PREDICTED: MARVEL domain-containing protein 3 isoform X2 [Anolis carolinensis]XP_008115065.1 PREDICTED: MARVEL domain-containing protein 3 isoform X2 [Anolis carolinensis]XP_008115066.1 PREDICTED: MARVEL domain-containing protein 3 isoform X2 [Anolis carolinensis]|eukprot:XP_008115062.1 PREDICTED: MARVEL domain-containing protein 3 isoform X2 [Anolis carolinensis]